MEKLPKGTHESSTPIYQQPKVRKRKYYVKIMFVGIVGCPQSKYGFDGQVMLKRISNLQKVSKGICYQRVSIHIYINEALHKTIWHNSVINRMSIDNLLSVISTVYDLY